MAGRDPIEELFAPLVPAGTSLAAMRVDELEVDDGDIPLFPDEEAAVANAVDKRRRIFAAGRLCARRALGLDIAIPMGQGGSPKWPTGFVGSITHTDDEVAVAVSRTLRSIGIDIESLARTAQTPDLLSMVTNSDERARFAALDLPIAALVFSAKESVYKCLFPTGGTFLDFPEVELAIDRAGTFTVMRARGYDVRGVQGRFAISDTHVATVVVIE